MARPRKFDEERALDAAMRVFWERGYEATSTQDLCDATGLGRSSIYNTFRSKHDLFERALARYLDAMTAVQTAVLDDAERPAADRVRALLANVVESETECRIGSGRALGCLGVNTVVELAARDPEAAAMLERDTLRRLAVYRAVMEQGRRDGSITSARGPEALARFLNATVAGLRVSSQGGAGRADLEVIVETAMDALVS
ncbi:MULTISPECIES: TetR/AcrR family transcriptional regulator [Streptomyces]|uniref:Copper outer membrane regulator n=1 Tax=Streptomyces chartreusis NRRL 3882 TaxID=1079985 RepID=A0A2N9B982_STRCX|nr:MULTISPECIES: TetR/AcrR family transcriptional regulator [Streptomyces]MYS93440.1 TetR family transcriptional regulator [Streptomyces sp. SID5464]SOR79917.1 Copper outer membrane regulator [Streptomyces chartreusis NRRL 3882]